MASEAAVGQHRELGPGIKRLLGIHVHHEQPGMLIELGDDRTER